MATEFRVKTRIAAKDDLSKKIAFASRVVRTKMVRSLTKLNKTAALATRRMFRLGAGLAKVGIGAAAAGVFGVLKLAKSHAVAADNMGKLVRRSGLTLRAYQEIRHAANLAGVAQDQFDKAVVKFTRNIGDAKAGTGGLTTLLKKVSPALLEQLKATTDNGVALEIMLRAMGKLDDPTKRAALAAAAFGRAGQQMTLMLEGGSEAFERSRKEAHRLGGVLDKEATDSAENYVDAVARMDLAMGGLKATIGNALLPVLQPMIERTTEWAVANRELISAKVAIFVQKIVKHIKDIDWKKTGKWISEASGKLVGFGKKAMEIFKAAAAVAGPFIQKIGALNLVLGALGFGILARVIGGLIAFKAWAAGAAASTKAFAIVMAAKFAPAVTFVGEVLGALGRVFVTLPLKSLAVVGLIFTDWEKLGEKLAELWPKIANGFIGAMKGAWRGMKVIGRGIIHVFSVVKNVVVRVFDILLAKLSNLIKDAIGRLKKNVDFLLEKVGLGGDVKLNLMQHLAPSLAAPGFAGTGATMVGGEIKVTFDNLPDAARVQTPKATNPKVPIKATTKRSTGTRTVGT